LISENQKCGAGGGPFHKRGVREIKRLCGMGLQNKPYSKRKKGQKVIFPDLGVGHVLRRLTGDKKNVSALTRQMGNGKPASGGGGLNELINKGKLHGRGP